MPLFPVALRRPLLLSAAGLLVVLAAALLAAPRLLGWARGPASSETVLEKLDVYGQVPEFSLVERSGRRVGRGDLLGKVWAVNFIYTKCTETCPTQSLQIARLQAEFADARDLQLVSITVDPQNDTREVLAAYAERYGAAAERWWFLTGDKREIYCLARGLNLSAVDLADPTPPACGSVGGSLGMILARLAPPPARAAHGSEGLIMHSARLVLVDRAARIRAYHLATDEASLKRLRPNLRALLGERGGASG